MDSFEAKSRCMSEHFSDDGDDLRFILPKAGIPALVSDYVNAMETQRTSDWCKCEWVVHPDDEELDIYNCGNCHHPHMMHMGVGMNDKPSYCTKRTEYNPFEEDSQCECTQWIDPPKRRLRRGDQSLECPIHTKEGFLLGFFEWLFKDESEAMVADGYTDAADSD